MKKVIVSILMIAGIAGTADAKMKAKAKKPAGQVPYSQNVGIDHSKDGAFSEKWAGQAQSPAPDANFAMGANQQAAPMLPGRTNYYGYPLTGVTKYGNYPVSMNAPYQGQDAPSYDGAAKNAYRNMRANNESEPLPSNNGK